MLTAVTWINPVEENLLGVWRQGHPSRKVIKENSVVHRQAGWQSD